VFLYFKYILFRSNTPTLAQKQHFSDSKNFNYLPIFLDSKIITIPSTIRVAPEAIRVALHGDKPSEVILATGVSIVKDACEKAPKTEAKIKMAPNVIITIPMLKRVLFNLFFVILLLGKFTLKFFTFWLNKLPHKEIFKYTRIWGKIYLEER
jgi:hypothetical protein